VRVLIVAVANGVGHWEDFFAALARRDGLELRVRAADVPDPIRRRFDLLATDNPRFQFQVDRSFLSEQRTGHMASVLFRPGSWQDLRAQRPDVVHVIGEAAYLATGQTVRFRNRFWPGVPVTVYAAQNVVTRFPWPFPWIEQYAYRNAALAVPITPAALKVLRAKGYAGPAEIVPLGVDLTRFRPRPAPPSGDFTVGFVGRLERHKGLADLLAAADRLGCRLLLVGDGSQRSWLEREAAQRPGRVELVPWVDREHLPEVITRMHVLTLPALPIVQRNVLPWVGIPLREQFGRVLLEAMACGVPVVGSRVGEIAHVIGPAGLIFPPGDVTAMTDALARLRDDSQLALALARAGIERAADSGWDRIAARVHQLWQGLAAR
jgi:glycosyltransferase involved in cell wall biosynthesis